MSRLANAMALAIWALLSACLLSGPTLAETIIEKVENRGFGGTPYLRLRGLTFEQCEARCLGDQRCIALEHYRGGGVVRRSPSCSLFATSEPARRSEWSDIGYKRVTAADGSSRRLRRTAPAQPKLDAGAEPKAAETTPAPTPAPEVARRSGDAPVSERSRISEPRRDAPVGDSGPSTAPGPAPPRPTEPAPGASRTGTAQPPAPTPPAPTAPAPATRSAQPTAPSPPPVARSVQPPPPPPPAATTPPPATRSARPAVAPTDAPGDAARTATATEERFHIVPVFYGTDRNRVQQEKRIGYGNDRAKRLELGRALVSVPLSHKVPNIERPRAWTIPYVGTILLEREDPNKHFTVREIGAMTREQMLGLVRQRLAESRTFRNQSIVFVHGYNTSFDNALYRTAQISYDLQFDGAAFAYSWPSGGGLAQYLYDRDSAQQAERFLYDFLNMVQSETGSTDINLIAHSMGNQVLLQVLRQLRLRAPEAVARINQIILASPDVDRDAFEAIAAEISGVGRGITLYASSNDVALQASRFVAAGKPRAGDVPAEGPVIVPGIDSIDISKVSTTYLSLGHSGYAEHSDLITDIATVFRHGTRPWSQRLRAYQPVTVPAGTYWRYQ